MKKILSLVIVGLLCLSMFSVIAPRVIAAETVIFQDDFESYATGTFPSSGGWQLVYNGAGNQYQVITSDYSASGSQSLQMKGRYTWSAVVAKDFASSSNLIGFEAYLMGTPGSWPSVGFGNEAIQPWGRLYGAVGVDTIDGYIVAGSQNLQPCTANTWYKIREVMDRNAGTFDVWIDDQLKGTNIQEANNPWEIQSLRFDVGWHNVLNYYDDVKVFEESPSQTYSVFFEESGVSNPAQVWSVSLDGYGTEYSNGPSNTIYTITFTGVANGGPYAFTVTPPSGFVAQPTSGAVTVSGGNFHQSINFNTAPTTYTFTLTAGSGGSISYSYSSGSGTVPSGQSQQLTVPQSCQFTLTANPDSTHVFQNWSPTGPVSVSNLSSASTTVTVNGNGGVTANFAYNLGVSISPISVSIQSSESVTFTATASGGSGGYTCVWYWTEYGVTPPNHGSQSTGASNKYIFTPSNAGDYGVYVIVTDSGGNTAQSLSSSVTVTDFQLKVSPQSQTIPITEDAVFVVGVVPINGFSGSVTLSQSNVPIGIFCDFAPSTIKPSQTSTMELTITSNAQVGSYSINIIGASKTLVRQLAITIDVTKTVGLLNIISISHVNEVGILPAFSIQQNFRIIVPSSSTLFCYWVQNVILVKKNILGEYQAAVCSEIWNFSDPNSKATEVPGTHRNSGYVYTISIPVTFNIASAISGNNLVLSNDFESWTWPIPSDNGKQPAGAFIVNYDEQTGTLGEQSPEFVVVGEMNSAQASFLDQTDGSVKSFGKLMGQEWTSCLVQKIASSNTAATKESSLGVQWDINGVDTAKFSYKSGSDKEGIIYAPLGFSTLQGGATTEDQTRLTGVSVSITDSSSPDGTSVAIATAALSGAPTGVVQVGTTPAAYYDVNVQGIHEGTATVCITNSGVLSQTTMQYWNGAQWVKASNAFVSGNTICGNIPVSALTGTIIAIGPTSAPSPPVGGYSLPTNAFTTNLLSFYLTFAAILFTGFVAAKRKPKKTQRK